MESRTGCIWKPMKTFESKRRQFGTFFSYFLPVSSPETHFTNRPPCCRRKSIQSPVLPQILTCFEYEFERWPVLTYCVFNRFSVHSKRLNAFKSIKCKFLEKDGWLLSLIPRKSNTDALVGSLGWTSTQSVVFVDLEMRLSSQLYFSRMEFLYCHCLAF